MLFEFGIFNWQSLNWPLIYLYDVIRESDSSLTDHFANAYVCEDVTQVNFISPMLMFAKTLHKSITLLQCNDV